MFVLALLSAVCIARPGRLAMPHASDSAARQSCAAFQSAVYLERNGQTLTSPAVQTGIEVLRDEGFAPLRGKRVGLITNPTGIDSAGRSTIDTLAHAPGVRLTALFGPEHGVRGDAAAGESVASGVDAATGIPVYSLYGRVRRPTEEMLRSVDVLVWDIQDVGARSYTFVSTLGLCMEAAAEYHKPFVVLDRPDPIGGVRVEGSPVAPGFRSFVGRYPLPYVYGLTAGELAGLLNGEGLLESGRHCDLTVVAMQGYRRSMQWQETGLPWRPPSPHVPHAETALYYSMTGILGELHTLDIGIGTARPFELAGAPGLIPDRFAAELDRRRLPGLAFRPATWTPRAGTYRGQECGGVQILITDPGAVELTRLNFELIDAAQRVAPGLRFFPSAEDRMFDLVCGGDRIRKMLVAHKPPGAVWSAWNAGARRFAARRRRYLLYP